MAEISVLDQVVGEGDGFVDVVVRLSAPSATPVTVAYATQDVGLGYDGYDYERTTGSLTFAAGETVKTIRINLLQSATYDSGALEHFRLNLSSPVNATLAKSSAMISIVDNDTIVATPSIFVRDVVVDEKAGTATFVVMLGGPRGQASSSNVSVQYSTASGSATAGSDFTAVSGTLNFAPGDVVKTVTVALTDDLLAEGIERFTLNLSNAINATIVDGQGVAIIGASDGPVSSAPAISVADMVVGESDGYIDVVVTLSSPSNSNVSVAFATQDVGTAYDGGYDYHRVTGTLFFAPGETTKTVRVQLEGSATYDNGALEHFRFNLSTPTNATLAKASAMISIVDNDTLLAVGEQPKLFVRDVVVDEKAGSASFVVLLGGPVGVASDSIVTVDYAVAGGTANTGSDFSGGLDPLNGQLVFAPGDVVKRVTVAITDDALAEGVERFTLNLSNAVNATVVDGQGVAIIGASDGPTASAPAISVADMVVGESDGYIDVVVTLSSPSNSNVSVAYATQDVGTAYDSGWDYHRVTGTLNFAPGETTKTVRVQLEGAATYDTGALEHFRFNLSAPTNATLSKASSMISIVDNDTLLAVGEQPKLFVRDIVVDEKAGSASFVVLLGGPRGVSSDSIVSVDYAVAGGTATAGSDFSGDLDPLNGQLVFAPGDVVKRVTVAITDDALAEGVERFTLNLSNAVNATVVDDQGVALIGTSDRPTSSAPAISVADTIVGESDGYIDVVVTLSSPSNSNVSVAYTTQDIGTAYDTGYDYQRVTGTLNFAPGETTKAVRVQLEGSATYDTGALEHFRFNLSAPTNATLSKASAMISIVDNDTLLAVGEQPRLFVRDVVVDEKAGSASFVVLLGGPVGVSSDSIVTVDYAVAGGTAAADSDFSGDLDPLNGQLVFAPGDVVKLVTVAITDDALAEGMERFTLNLSNAVNATVVDDQGVALIGTSDRPAASAPAISVADMVVGESDGYIDVVVTLSSPSNSNVSVAYTTQDIGTAYDTGYDYQRVTGTLNFAPGETTKTVRVQLEGSATYDTGALEHFRFNLSTPTNATLAKASAMITIVDNDTLLAVGEQPRLFVRDVVVDEKAGSASFVVLLGGPVGVRSDSIVTVDYAVAGGTATQDSDFSGDLDPLNGQLIFAPGDVVKLVTVAITDDALAEGVERLTLTLGNAVNATIADSHGVAVIGASDGPTTAAPTITVANKAVSEGDGYLDMVVSLSTPSTSNVSVNYATQDVPTGYTGWDYYGVSGTLHFAPGETTKTIRIQLETAATYDVAGALETFRLSLSNAVNATIATPTITVTIVDDDVLGENVFSHGISDDIYFVNAANDKIVENPDGGTDLVYATVDYTLPSQVEQLTLLAGAVNGTGNEIDNLLTGNEVANTLTGGAGNDTLDGMDGADTLVGGPGNDTYLVDSAGDVVTELANEGTDLVRSAITYTLGATVENLTLTSAAAINGTGNALANVLTGNDAANVLTGLAGNDTLDGLGGADTMVGGAGNDTYGVDHAGDVVTELAGEGVDLVRASITYTLGATLENLTLTGSSPINGTGNALANVLTGNGAANRLDGAAGADTMVGGGGDDTYVVASLDDVVVEAAGGGFDLVETGLSYTLPAEVEALRLLGTSALNATGNALANTLYSNAGNNTLDGMSGTDTASYLHAASAVTVSLAVATAQATLGAGTDTLISIENLTGSAFNDRLTGNAGPNVLDGGLGADRLEGGTGNDTYVVDNTGDLTVETSTNPAEIDTVLSSVTRTLGANLENLTLTGAEAINGSGNDLANLITGNGAANSLFGGAGADTLIGGTGADTLNGGLGADRMEGGFGSDVFIVDNAGDVVVELAGQGNDRISTALSYTLGTNIEGLTLGGTADVDGTGNELPNLIQGNAGSNRLSGLVGNDTLTGGAGNDTLDGGTGADYMVGQEGDDTYYIDSSGDQTIESYPTFGVDHAITSISRTISTNIENMTLVGAAVLGSGNALANMLTGNDLANTLNGVAGDDTILGGAGNDTLNGGLGADRMEGGAGDDVYAVDSAGDVVVELANEGIDRVSSTVSWVLGDDIENLTLSGTGAINGTGNGLANTITGTVAGNAIDGGAGDDTLSGFDGNDTLTGGMGNDRLSGGNGADRFRFVTTGEGVDTITDFASGSDKIHIVAANFGLVAGSAANLVVNGNPGSGAAAFIYTSATGNLAFDADGNGPGAAVSLALLSNKPATLLPGDIAIGP